MWTTEQISKVIDIRSNGGSAIEISRSINADIFDTVDLLVTLGLKKVEIEFNRNYEISLLIKFCEEVHEGELRNKVKERLKFITNESTKKVNRQNRV